MSWVSYTLSSMSWMLHAEFDELHKLNYTCKFVKFDKLNSKLDELDKL